jgi:hypothetical protein
VFLIDLFEARQETAMQTLARYLVRPNMFVTFVNIEKLGINPRSEHTSTPSGIYAYPLMAAYKMMETKQVSFAGDRKYICLFEAHGNFLDLQNYSSTDYENDMDGLAEQWQLLDPKNEEFAMSMLVGWEEDMSRVANGPGRSLGFVMWRLIHRISERADRIYNREAMVISNAMLRRLGYDGVIDNGGSIIHVHEPAQALFLRRDVCRVVEFLINDHIEGHTPAFPKRGEKKIKGFKEPKDEDGYPIHNSDEW